MHGNISIFRKAHGIKALWNLLVLAFTPVYAIYRYYSLYMYVTTRQGDNGNVKEVLSMHDVFLHS